VAVEVPDLSLVDAFGQDLDAFEIVEDLGDGVFGAVGDLAELYLLVYLDL
jgi:hypothetical protein